MTPDDAEDFTAALGKVFQGSWEQILWAGRQGVPQALGLTTKDWVEQRLGGYVKLAAEERRELVKQLEKPKELGGEGLQLAETAAVLGVSDETILRDRKKNQATSTAVEVAPEGSEGVSEGASTNVGASPNGRAERYQLDHRNNLRAERAARIALWDANPEADGVPRLLTGDLRVCGAEIPDASVDLVFTDPPYPKAHLPRYSDLSALAARVLRPNGMLVAYSGQLCLPEVIQRLNEHLSYWWMGAIFHGSAGMLQLQDQPTRKFVNLSKPLLFYVRRDFQDQVKTYRDSLKGGGAEKDTDAWQQGLAEASFFIKQMTPKGGTVLDPFLGGGTTAVAALKAKRRFIGIEIDPEAMARAKERIAQEFEDGDDRGE